MKARIGDIVRLSGLQSAVHLNGKTAEVLTAPDDEERVTVLVDGMGHPVRVHKCKLLGGSHLPLRV